MMMSLSSINQENYYPFKMDMIRALPNLRGMLQDEYEKIWAVHRLDKETSGIIFFAKNAETHKFLNRQFSDRLVKKIYWAIVQGFPVWAEKMIDFPLKINGDRKHRTIIDQKLVKRRLLS